MQLKKQIAIATVLGVSGMLSGQASAMELLSNGDFETGTFAGWTVTDLAGGSGSWFIDDADGIAPFSSLPTTGPAGGAFYATSDQTGPGTHALEQGFMVPLGATSVIVSFDMFINDFDSGPIIDAIGLDHTGPSNQHGRVDIMSAAAAAFDTAGGVVSNLFLGVVPGGSGPNPYVSYLFDITASVTAGSSYKIRFAETDNSGNFLQGVDNVSVRVAGGQVPVPATLALLGLGLAGLGWRTKSAN